MTSDILTECVLGKYVSAMAADGRLEPKISVKRTILSQTIVRDPNDMASSDVYSDDIIVEVR